MLRVEGTPKQGSAIFRNSDPFFTLKEVLRAMNTITK
jgi:hypothetical protein